MSAHVEANVNMTSTTSTKTKGRRRLEEAEAEGTGGSASLPSSQSSPSPPSTSQLISCIMEEAGGSKGLANMPKETLRLILNPVLKSLEELNAESLLDLERVNYHGARLRDGVNVRPIHNDIVPQVDSNSVRYIHIAEVPDQYSCGVFVFPPFAKIPLHDHPGMCVLSRLLYGDVQCLSLDFVREEPREQGGQEHEDNYDDLLPQQQSSTTTNRRNSGKKRQEQPHSHDFSPVDLPTGARRALKNDVSHLHAPAVTMLFPYEGNLHEFFAGPQGAAILDILLPPYDLEEGRDCTFYDIYDEQPNSDPNDTVNVNIDNCEEFLNSIIQGTKKTDDSSNADTCFDDLVNEQDTNQNQQKFTGIHHDDNSDTDTTSNCSDSSSAKHHRHQQRRRQQQQQQQEEHQLLQKQVGEPCWVFPTDEPEEFHCLAGKYGRL